MSSITLPSTSFRPAQPLAGGAAARGLANAVNLWATAMRTLRHRAAIRALRERALAHQATDPSYAADLLAVADRQSAVVDPA